MLLVVVVAVVGGQGPQGGLSEVDLALKSLKIPPSKCPQQVKSRSGKRTAQNKCSTAPLLPAHADEKSQQAERPVVLVTPDCAPVQR